MGSMLDDRKCFEPLTEDGPLLWTNREGPFNQMSEFLFGLDVLSDATVLRTFLKHEIHHLFGLLLLGDDWGWGHFLSLGFLSFGLLTAIPP